MRRRVALSLGGAGIGVLLLALTWFAVFHIGFVQRADDAIFNGFYGLHYKPRVSRVATWVADLCDPKPYVFLAAIPILVALARGRVRLALVIAAILLGANFTTQLVKPLLGGYRADPSLGFTPVSASSWPSGHATAVMSLALTMVLAAPGRWRPYVGALGAAFAVAVSYSFLTLGWHYPSDVLGGFLVAGTWTLVGIATLFASDAPRSVPLTAPVPISLRAALTPPALALGGALVLAAVVAIARPAAVVSYVRGHEAFVVGALAIGALAVVLATGLVLTLGRFASSR
jgi:membrane-associated phospholipid phosphatase